MTILITAGIGLAVLLIVGAIAYGTYHGPHSRAKRLAYVEANPASFYGLALKYSPVDGLLKLYAVGPHGRRFEVATWEELSVALPKLQKQGLFLR